MSFRLYHDDVVDVRGVLLGDVFVLQVPFLAESLHGYTDGVVTVLAVDFVDGFGKGGLFLAVDGIEQASLDGIVRTDVPHDDACFLVPESAVGFPTVAQQAYSDGDKLLMVVGGDLQMLGAREVVLRHVLAEAAGIGEYGDGLAYGVLFAELAGALGGKVGYGFFYIGQTVKALGGKASAGADGFLVRQLFDGDAAFALQLFPGAYTGDGHLPTYPTFGFLYKIPCGGDTVIGEFLGVPMADAPYIADGEKAEGFLALFVGVHQAYTFVSLVFLGKLGGHLGECLGGSDTQRDGDARALGDGLDHQLAIPDEVSAVAHTAEVEEGFIYGIDVEPWSVSGKQGHHPAAHVAVEVVVGREDSHIVLLQTFLYLIEGFAHLDAQCLALFAARNDAAVVVAEDNHGLVPQIGMEHPLARTVEIVAVGQSEEFHRPLAMKFLDGVGEHSPDDEIIVGGHFDGREAFVVGDEPRTLVGLVHLELLEGEFTIHVCHHEIAVVHFERLVDDDDVAVADACILERIARHFRQERTLLVADNLLVQVDAFCHIVLARTGKPCLDASVHKRQLQNA